MATLERGKSKLFQTRLRRSRRLRQLSQAQLAERTGLQASAVSHYESGARTPSFRNLRRLSQALEVTTDYLVGSSSEPEVSPRADEPLYEAFSGLSASDRELARRLVSELANRARG